MPTVTPDLPHQLAVALLGHITDRLEAVDAKPKRAYVCADVGVPADDCCKGTAWVRVATITATDGSTNPLRQLYPASTGTPPGWSIMYEAGVLRCAPTIKANGQPPAAADMAAAAAMVSQDRQALRQAIVCDFPADIEAVNADGQLPGAWLPLFAGDCVGGWISTQVVTTMVM